MATDPVKSRAIIAYLPPPIGRPEPAAVRAVEAATGVPLLEYVDGLVREIFDELGVSDWDSAAGLDRAVAAVKEGMAERHPELDAEAMNSLARMWSYSAWKSGGR
jgi:hypothetical protein